ncbi:squalene/phytoene synthase family protein [Palleronia aestuarii]|uniref:squalene/phytoene synthase family protein n=1 Tax=Palleronia aestuarii TaxID=568105 RepID=UPI001B876883|nr:squalene/phytoene synthase family protein [Palleronia aestuarii]
MIETTAMKSENFPVGSLLLRRDLRPIVHAFYGFARRADNVADDPNLTADAKLARLGEFDRGLDGTPAGEPVARTLRETLETTGHAEGVRHARALLGAFRQDAIKTRYATWEELLAYCRMSADPVGRFLLDLHGEAPSTHAPSDALCTALQILNHLQDLGRDFRELDRIYMPEDLLPHSEAALRENHASPALRAAIDDALCRAAGLLHRAAELPALLASRRLSGEVRAIHFLATRLHDRLCRADPMAGRVAPGRTDFAGAAIRGAAACLRRPQPRAMIGGLP